MMKNSAEILYDALIDRVMGGDLPAGAILSEGAIARDSGLSRTPVREALQRLRREGILTLGPRRTLVVRTMTQNELHDLFEALGAIEGMCARLSALRMRDIDIHRLAQIVKEGDRSPENFNEINERFHAALHEGSGNPVLRDLLHDLHLRSLPLRAIQFRLRQDRVSTSQAEHRAILDAIAARNGPAAEHLMIQHIAATHSVVFDLVLANTEHP